MEFKASHAYLSLSNFYAHDSQALLGFSKMFEHHWKEELEHAEKMINYISKRGGVIGLFFKGFLSLKFYNLIFLFY